MNSFHLSKYLSLLLRHKPEALQLNMDKNGWVNVDELLEKLQKSGKKVNYDDLLEVVANNNKKRFKLDTENNRIRAKQGHSIAIDAELPEKTPPAILYHGTAQKNLESIQKEGLKSRSRLHVHLSKDEETAILVGQRHGEPIILEIDCHQMLAQGHTFYLSENGVWLTNQVPATFIRFPS